MANYSSLPIKTRAECICEMKGLAKIIVKNSKENKINLLVVDNKMTILNKIFHLFNDIMRQTVTLDRINTHFYTFIIKTIRDIKFMPYTDTSENIVYVFNELCYFLEISGKNFVYSPNPIKMEIDLILAIKE